METGDSGDLLEPWGWGSTHSQQSVKPFGVKLDGTTRGSISGRGAAEGNEGGGEVKKKKIAVGARKGIRLPTSVSYHSPGRELTKTCTTDKTLPIRGSQEPSKSNQTDLAKKGGGRTDNTGAQTPILSRSKECFFSWGQFGLPNQVRLKHLRVGPQAKAKAKKVLSIDVLVGLSSRWVAVARSPVASARVVTGKRPQTQRLSESGLETGSGE